jgi:hypothetical protein
MRGSQARTERGTFLFSVSELANHTPFIYAEWPDNCTMPTLEDAFVGFDLPDGTTFDQARRWPTL